MIHIKDDWYIEVDERSYNLQQFVDTYIDKDGVERNIWKNVTYHGTLTEALDRYLRRVAHDSLQDDMDIVEALERLRIALKQARDDIAGITEGM